MELTKISKLKKTAPKLKSKDSAIAERVRSLGLKWTPTRAAVLDCLGGKHRLLTVDEVVQALRKKAAVTADWSTVFRTLRSFEAVGLVAQTTLADGKNRYELQLDDHGHHHHHVVCRKCDAVELVETCAIRAIENEVKAMGFSDISHRLEFSGVCQNCASA